MCTDLGKTRRIRYKRESSTLRVDSQRSTRPQMARQAIKMVLNDIPDVLFADDVEMDFLIRLDTDGVWHKMIVVVDLYVPDSMELSEELEGYVNPQLAPIKARSG